MQPPDSPEGSGPPSKSSQFSTTRKLSRQPRQNPHAHLLPRQEQSCPSHLTGSKRTHWLKAGKKAQRNQQLLQALPSFNWPQSNYDQPIFIHHLTLAAVLEQILEKIRHVNIYVIDTESESTASSLSPPIPSTIQIQAVHNSLSSTVLLIETKNSLHYPFYRPLLEA